MPDDIVSSFDLLGITMTYQRRCDEFRACLLGGDVVDLRALRRLVNGGLPEGGSGVKGFRSLIWKLLLGYLPVQRANWDSTLRYCLFCYECLCECCAVRVSVY